MLWWFDGLKWIEVLVSRTLLSPLHLKNLGKSSVLPQLLAEIIQGKSTQLVTHPPQKREWDVLSMLVMTLRYWIMLSYVGFVSWAEVCASTHCHVADAHIFPEIFFSSEFKLEPYCFCFFSCHRNFESYQYECFIFSFLWIFAWCCWSHDQTHLLQEL